jgi:hypothetical protein
LNVACLEDGALEDAGRSLVRYEDGRNDRWDWPPAETRHL